MHQSNSNLTGKSAGDLSHQIMTSLQRSQVPSCLTKLWRHYNVPKSRPVSPDTFSPDRSLWQLSPI